MDVVVTFLEGVVTFVSPCLLPMLPLYLAYFMGGSEPGTPQATKQTLRCAVGFVLGFGLVFTVLGAFAGSLGGLLLRNRQALDIACGILMVALGLNYAGLLRIPVLQRTWHPASGVMPRGFVSSVLFGTVFAIGWSPCVGTFLASALGLAATSGSTLAGVVLLASYSVGLGLPFVLAAVLVGQLEGALEWVKRHYDVVNKVCGAFLVVMGVLMATGTMGDWLRMLAS